MNAFVTIALGASCGMALSQACTAYSRGDATSAAIFAIIGALVLASIVVRFVSIFRTGHGA